jgi:hypothetical protein
MVGSHPVPLASNKIALTAHGLRAEFAPPFVAAPQSVQQLISMPAILFRCESQARVRTEFRWTVRYFTRLTPQDEHGAVLLCHLA